MVKGVNGVVVAVAAIVATVLIGGTVGALNPVTVETTDYDYVTNINSLYDLEEQPVPSEYSPAGNWNGWKLSSGATATGGISYTTLNRYNGIPVLVDAEQQTASGNIPTDLEKPIPPGTEGLTTVYYFSDTQSNITYTPTTIINLAVFFAWLMDSGVETDGYDVWTLTTANLGIAVIDEFENYRVPTTTVETSKWSGVMPSRIEWNRTNGSVGFFNSSGELYRSEQAENLVIGAGGVAQITNTTTEQTPFGTTYSASSYESINPTYIDTTKGIKITAPVVYWSNGYDVAKMRFVFQTNTANCKTTFSATLYDASTGSQLSLPGYGTITMQMQVYTDSNKDVTIYLRMIGNTGQDPATALFDLGRWPGAVIDMDLYSGIATASGIRSFGDFRNYETSGAAETQDLNITGAAIKTMRATNTGTGLTFGIDRTSVYLTASETVMVNPSVTVGEHFPAMANSFQIRYDSFLKYGDSITINGNQYTVDDKKLLDVPYLYNNEIVYIDVDLTDLRITVNENELTMQYSNGDSYSAALQTPTVEFGGVWYFDSDLYSVVTGTATEYDYTGGFNLDWSGSIVVYLISLAVGSLAITKFRNPGILDWLIVAFAGAAGWVML